MFKGMYYGPWRKQDVAATLIGGAILLAMVFAPTAQILRTSLCWAGVPYVVGCD